MTPRTWSIAALGLAVLGGTTLHTDYSASRSVHYEAFMEITSETTRMERDGQPMEMPAGAGASGQEREVAWTDKVLEHKDGKPVRVERTFGGVKQTSTMNFGGEEQSREQKGALDGVKLELKRGEEGKIEAEVKDGDAPGESLEGHKLELLLDAFLPEGEVADGDEWTVEADAIRRGLGLDLSTALFPPEPEPERGSGGSGGEGRRGPRGPRGGAASALFTQAALEGKCKLKEGTEEVEGVACRVITITIEADGQLEEQSFGGGGSRGRAFGMPSISIVETNYEIKLEGKLLFDAKSKLPVSLELEGTTKVDSNREFEGRDGTMMKFGSTQEGQVKFTASLSVE
jgi:hypothetical protein